MQKQFLIFCAMISANKNHGVYKHECRLMGGIALNEEGILITVMSMAVMGIHCYLASPRSPQSHIQQVSLYIPDSPSTVDTLFPMLSLQAKASTDFFQIKQTAMAIFKNQLRWMQTAVMLRICGFMPEKIAICSCLIIGKIVFVEFLTNGYGNGAVRVSLRMEETISQICSSVKY